MKTRRKPLEEYSGEHGRTIAGLKLVAVLVDGVCVQSGRSFQLSGSPERSVIEAGGPDEELMAPRLVLVPGFVQ